MGRKNMKDYSDTCETSYLREWNPNEVFRDMSKIGQQEMFQKSIDLDIWKCNIDLHIWKSSRNLDTNEKKELHEKEGKYSRMKRKLDTLLKDDSIPEEKRRKEFKKLITQKWELLQSIQRKKIEIFAKKHKLKFDESKKEQIINEIIKRHGFCQSKRKQIKENACPCGGALKRIMRRGTCRRGLFIVDENIRPETKKLESWIKDEKGYTATEPCTNG